MPDQEVSSEVVDAAAVEAAAPASENQYSSPAIDAANEAAPPADPAAADPVQQELPSADDIANAEAAKELAQQAEQAELGRQKLLGEKVLYFNAEGGKVKAHAAQITDVDFVKETFDLVVLHPDRAFVKQGVKVSELKEAGTCLPPQ